MVGEAGLTGPDAGVAGAAATHDRRGRSRMMGCAKRRVLDERAACRQESGDGVDPRDLERLVQHEPWEQTRETPTEHRLPRSRRAREEQVVAPGGGQLESPSSALVPSDVGEVRVWRLGRRRDRFDRLGLPFPAKIGRSLDEMADGNRLDAREGNLCGGVGCAEKASDARSPSRLGTGKGTRHGSEPAVEAELSERGVVGEAIGRQLARSSKHGERDREIEARALFPQAGRCEVDSDAAKRPLQLSACDAAANALLRLLARLVRQADDRERRHASLQVRLDLDRSRLEADYRVRERPGNHVQKLRVEIARMAPGVCRISRGSVSKACVDDAPGYRAAQLDNSIRPPPLATGAASGPHPYLPADAIRWRRWTSFSR